MVILKLNINKYNLSLCLSALLLSNGLFASAKEHTVKKGESLYQISKKYDIPVDELKKLNNLKSNNLQLGQKLALSKKDKKSSNEDKKKKTTGSSANTSTGDKEYHVVKSGDNLYNIAKKYNISVDQLKELNNLSNNRLDRGQKLIVSKNSPARSASSNDNERPNSPSSNQSSQNSQVTQTTTSDKIHKVKKGETLSAIAKKYKLDIDDLKKLNKLKNSKVNIGQKLIISKGVTKKINQPENHTQSNNNNNNYQTHIVARNETLSKIAKKYKMSQDQIVELNNLKTRRLKRGQKLKVYDNMVTSITPQPLSTPTVIRRNEPVRLQDKFVMVRKGQTLYNIAKTYDIDIVDLIDYNSLNGFAVKEGQKIWLEPGHQSAVEEITPIQTKTPTQNMHAIPVHIVSRGENLFRIAKNYNVKVDDLKKWNSLSTLTVKEGQKIYIGNPSGLMAQEDIEFSKPNRQIIKPYSRTPILPLSSAKVISNFGMRSGRMHKGLDFAAPTGEPIYATLPGKVVFSGVQRGYGNVIILEHENFMMTVYGHNDANLVRVGDEVTQGQIIGLVGSTGNAQGSHLHFEYRVRGVAINPRDFLIGLP